MEKLAFINAQMELLAVPYQLGEWTQKITYPYFVGEFNEDELSTENGYQHTDLIITGFHRGSFEDLEAIKERIRKHFADLRATTPKGAIVVNYASAFSIPSGEMGLKKIQINLDIQEWKGDL